MMKLLKMKWLKENVRFTYFTSCGRYHAWRRKCRMNGMNDSVWNNYALSFQVATNGIISPHDLPMEKQYVDDGFPTEFPVIAPFLADIDTSNGKGAIYYRQTESPSILNRIAAEVQKGFPDTRFTPTHAIIATWENVAAYNEITRTPEFPIKVRESDGKGFLHIN